MREVLGDGGIAMSQNRLNMDRENKLIGQWKTVLKSAAAGSDQNNPNNKFLGVQEPHKRYFYDIFLKTKELFFILFIHTCFYVIDLSASFLRTPLLLHLLRGTKKDQ